MSYVDDLKDDYETWYAIIDMAHLFERGSEIYKKHHYERVWEDLN